MECGNATYLVVLSKNDSSPLSILKEVTLPFPNVFEAAMEVVMFESFPMNMSPPGIHFSLHSFPSLRVRFI